MACLAPVSTPRPLLQVGKHCSANTIAALPCPNANSSTFPSTEADTYAKNHHIHSSQHAIIVCTVVRGNVKQLYAADHSLTSPGAGFDSVEGMERQRGGAINYKEIVVYREDAIIPRAVIMYTRKGWAPPA